MMVSGIVLWGAGAALTGVGTGQFLSHEGCSVSEVAGSAPRPLSAGSGERIGVAQQAFSSCNDSLGVAGFAMLIAGQIASVIAIPLFVVGNGRVPIGHGIAGPKPELRVGAGSAALRLSF
jgi:hypothetical protein